MKFSPTVTLALALAAGLAGTAAAQTAPPAGAMSPMAQPSGPAAAQAPAQSQPGAATSYGMPAHQGAVSSPGQGSRADAMPDPMQRGTTPPRGAAEMPGTTAMPSGAQRSDQVRQAQERLSALGLYKGPSDGQIDPDTRAAIANFQQQNGLRRTADLDPRTLDRLMANQASGTGMPPISAPPQNRPVGGPTPAPAGAGDNTAGQTFGR